MLSTCIHMYIHIPTHGSICIIYAYVYPRYPVAFAAGSLSLEPALRREQRDTCQSKAWKPTNGEAWGKQPLMTYNDL